MKIATWNVNGIRKRQAEFSEWIGRERPDVVCLQEIKASPDQIPAEIAELDGYWSYWHGAGGYSGVGLHVAKSLTPERPVFSHPPFDHETRIVTAQIAIAGAIGGAGAAGEKPGGKLTVGSVYVPNGGKDFGAKLRFLEALAEYAATCRSAGASLVLCGDLNVARTEIDVYPRDRNPRAIGQLPQERALIETLIGHGLSDVARRLAPDDDHLYTWWAPWRNLRQRNMGWRIDYVLASEALAARAVGCVSAREIGTSDHAPVTATFAD